MLCNFLLVRFFKTITVNDFNLTESFFPSSTSGLPAVPPGVPSRENAFRITPALLSGPPGFGGTGPTTPSAILGPNTVRVTGLSRQEDLPAESLLTDPWEVSGCTERFFLGPLEFLVPALLIGEWGGI